ncbi:MAG: hypothetical protein ACTSO9_19980 [Candidatus Helarchaeota archaeon]
MSIYASQTLGNTLTPRFACYSSEDFNIATYYGGEMIKDMALLALEENEEGKKYKLPLIDFFYKIARNEICQITNDIEFQKYFSSENKEIEGSKKELGAFEKRFDIFLSIFNNFIQTIDNRLTQIENLILKMADYNKK